MVALALSKVCEIEKLAWPARLTRALGRLVLVLLPVSLSIYLLLLFVVSLTAQEPVLPFWREAAMRAGRPALAGLAIGAVAMILISRRFDPWLMRKLREATKRTHTDKFSDVREVASRKHAPVDYDPRDYFTKDKLFLGLHDEPVYVSLDTWRDSNCEIMGVQGCGKTTLAQNICVQDIMRGWPVVVCDPKPRHDRHFPAVMQMITHQLGLPFVAVDLT